MTNYKAVFGKRSYPTYNHYLQGQTLKKPLA